MNPLDGFENSNKFFDYLGVSSKDTDLEVLFKKNPLSMLVLIRFAIQYNWRLTKGIIKIIKHNSSQIEKVDTDNILSELEGIIDTGSLYRGIQLMRVTGLLSYILPEVAALRGVKQNPKSHAEGDVYKHTIEVLKNAPHTIEGQLAALLHDVGKPATQGFLGEKITFYDHHIVGAEIAKAILDRLHVNKDIKRKVVFLVRNHMKADFPTKLQPDNPEHLKQFITEVGDEMLDSLLGMIEADFKGSWPVLNNIPEIREEVKRLHIID